MELTRFEKRILGECKEALQRDDLIAVYKYLETLYMDGEIYDNTILHITQFFYSKGIKIENYLYFVPSGLFDYAMLDDFPQHWKQKDSIVVPQGLEIVHPNAFYSIMIDKLSLPYVKELQDGSFFYSTIKELYLGENIRDIDREAFLEAKIGYIYVPNKRLYNLVKSSHYDFKKNNTPVVIV